MTLMNNSEEGFSSLVLGGFGRWSLGLGGSIVSLNGKVSFKPYTYIYT